MRTLPPWLENTLANPPHTGEGVHNWLFKVARQLHHHMPVNAIAGMLAQAVASCGRRVTEKEIRDAVARSIACAWTPSAMTTTPSPSSAPKQRWRPVNSALIQRIITDGPTLADLWELSPARMDCNTSRTEAIIDTLFPEDSLLCCATDLHNSITKPRGEWRGQLAEQSFIVPSPMAAPTGTTQDGRQSARCLNNVGPRRFLVVEFDRGSIDGHASILHHLAHYGPLVMAVHSGGKSLHGWFYCPDGDSPKAEEFFSYAVSLGGDPATYTRCQLVRMPDGRRSNGAWQPVYYLNPRSLSANRKA